ncbi:DUF1775 domain-containing protein [Streptomyces sp. NPDC017936]|uniref:DUF1775 domain-containing protein n=1 Tax=Streptomyces sp. NPDC017936 TaxID=3365016 RepID=UPI0037BB6895
MSRTTLPRAARRLTVPAAAAAAVLLAAVPAGAHVEVESDRAQALAETVEITFTAESESSTAGITQLRVVLPEGIEPADVVYGEGPAGWTFSTTADGYAVKGPAVKVGEDAEHSIVVRQLPDARELVFKTLQTYSDGRVDRWIELGESEGDGHGNEAPVLELEAAAPGAKTVSPSPSASPTPSPTAVPAAGASARATRQAADTEKDDADGLSTTAWTGIVAVVLVVAAGAAFLLRRRSGSAE